MISWIKGTHKIEIKTPAKISQFTVFCISILG
jgi:hypothetical protein